MNINYLPIQPLMPPYQQNPQREFRISVIKIAIFAFVLVLNNAFLYNIFYIPAIWLITAMPEMSNTAFYAIQWTANDLSAYTIPAICAALLFHSDFRGQNPYKRHSTYISGLSTCLIFFSCTFLGSLATMFTNFVAEILDILYGTGEIPDAMESALPTQGDLGTFTVLLITVSIVAPICEELIFRKLLLYPLRKHGDGFAIFVTALFFGFSHGNFDQFPYAFVVGLLFGLLAINANSVLPTMILHTINNLLVTLGSYSVSVLGESNVTLAIENTIAIALNIAFWIGIPAVIIIVASGMLKSDYTFQLSKGEKAKLLFTNPATYCLAFFLCLMMTDVASLIGM